ncbi:pyruvate decarboxylase [Hysterangium stoloniferum]|nr:pyruvate decarboxylase [Hysterangium stoloniferum]
MSKQQSSEITIGNYLLARLVQLGVKSMFGVPGDFNLGFLNLVEDHDEIDWVGNCNELNAAYAADGYARVAQAVDKHSIGVLTTTFGVGELSAINGIAGAFSEHIPVLHIVGTPSTYQQKMKPLLHHTLGDGRFDAYTKAAEHFTSRQAILMDGWGAAVQIDKLLTECLVQARPVYLSLPTDLVNEKISSAPLEEPLSLIVPPNDPDGEHFVLEEIVKHVEAAGDDVAILVDVCAVRHNVVPEVREFAQSTGFPIFSAPMGKGIIPETLETFRGIYSGDSTWPEVLKQVESAKKIISVGALKTDFNSGGFTYRVPTSATIELHSDHTKIGYAVFPDIRMKYLLPKLTERLKSPANLQKLSASKWTLSIPQVSNNTITHAWLWPRMSAFFRENDIVVAETGTASFGSFDIVMPLGGIYLAQILWGSIGWSVGSTLGAAMAAQERELGRVCLFIGDGSLQLTVQEISTMIRQGLKPIIFVIGNKGYTIERILGDRLDRQYNDIADWNFGALLSVLGATEGEARSYVARTKDEFSAILDDETFAKTDVIQLVEIIMDKYDAPAPLRRMVELSKKNTF